MEKVLFASSGGTAELRREDDRRASRQAGQIETVDAGVGPAVTRIERGQCGRCRGREHHRAVHGHRERLQVVSAAVVTARLVQIESDEERVADHRPNLVDGVGWRIDGIGLVLRPKACVGEGGRVVARGIADHAGAIEFLRDARSGVHGQRNGVGGGGSWRGDDGREENACGGGGAIGAGSHSSSGGPMPHGFRAEQNCRHTCAVLAGSDRGQTGFRLGSDPGVLPRDPYHAQNLHQRSVFDVEEDGKRFPRRRGNRFPVA